MNKQETKQEVSKRKDEHDLQVKRASKSKYINIYRKHIGHSKVNTTGEESWKRASVLSRTSRWINKDWK